MTAPTPCYHCGSPVPADTPWRICLDNTSHALCCPGCEAVAHAIVQGGLESYYQQRTELPGKPGQQPAMEAAAWSYFDDPDRQATFVVSESESGLVSAFLVVEGITCVACAWLIEHRLNALDGVTASSVNLVSHRLKIHWDLQKIQLSQLMAELAMIGYTALPDIPDPTKQRVEYQQRLDSRFLCLASVGVLLSLYTHHSANLSATLSAPLQWLLWVVITLVMLPLHHFFRQALRDLYHCTLGPSVPVTFAIGSAYLASSYALLYSAGEHYFGFLGLFAFTLLLGRFFLGRMTLKRAAHLAALPLSAIRLEQDDLERILPTDELAPGDRIVVKTGQRIPVDGVIEQGESSIDESPLTGEPLPAARQAGERVLGGCQNLESTLVIKATRTGADTCISHIQTFTETGQQYLNKPLLPHMRYTHWGVVWLLFATVFAGIVVWQFKPFEVLPSWLAMLTVASAYPLVLAAPVALTTAHWHLCKRGVALAQPGTLFQLARTSRVVFIGTSRLLDDAATAVGLFQANGLTVELLAGNSDANAALLAQQLGISNWQVCASPSEQQAHIHNLQRQGERVLVVDNCNNEWPDNQGFSTALIIDSDTSNLALLHADIIVLSPRLIRLAQALAVARQAVRLARQNMLLGCCFSLVAWPLAATGVLAPWQAIIGVALSVLVVLGNTWRALHSCMPNLPTQSRLNEPHRT